MDQLFKYSDLSSINLHVSDFTLAPGPRLKVHGPNSGEQFRDEFLIPNWKKAMDAGKKLKIDLDGTAGYASPFLEESFGGLLRFANKDYEAMMALLDFKSDDDDYLLVRISRFMKKAGEMAAA